MARTPPHGNRAPAVVWAPAVAWVLAAAWALVVAVVCMLELRLLTAAWGTVRAARAGNVSFDELVTGLALVALAAALAWLSVAVTACLVAETGRVATRLTGRVAEMLAPRGLRLLVRLVCGLAMAGPFGALPATAAEPAGRSCDSLACVAPPAALPLPDRPDVTADRLAARAATPTGTSTGTPIGTPTGTPIGTPASLTVTTPPGVITVQPGDSLWSIAAAHLPDDAGTAGIAAAWPRWYQANRAAIGGDPDLIHPGTELVVPDDPSAPTSASTEH